MREKVRQAIYDESLRYHEGQDDDAFLADAAIAAVLDDLIAEALAEHKRTQHLADSPESLDSEKHYGPLFYVADDPWFSGSMGWMVANWLRDMREEGS